MPPCDAWRRAALQIPGYTRSHQRPRIPSNGRRRPTLAVDASSGEADRGQADANHAAEGEAAAKRIRATTFAELLEWSTAGPELEELIERHPAALQAYRERLSPLGMGELCQLSEGVEEAQLRTNPDGYGWHAAPPELTGGDREYLERQGFPSEPMTNRELHEERERLLEGAIGIEG